MPLSVVAAAGAVCNFDPIPSPFLERGLLHAVVFLCIIFSQFARCGRQPPASAIWGSTWRRIFRPTRHPGTMPGRSRRPPRPYVSGRSPCGIPPRAPCRSTTCARRRTPPRRSGVRIPPGVVRGSIPAGRSCRAPPPATHRPRGGDEFRPRLRARHLGQSAKRDESQGLHGF